MRKFISFAAACITACSFLLISMTASAATGTTDTKWAPTGTASFSISMDFSGAWGNVDAFGIYDIDDLTDPDSTGIQVGALNIATLNFTNPGTGWVVTVVETSQTVSLGDTNLFGFYYQIDEATRAYTYEYDGTPGENYLIYGAYNALTLPEILISGANPVPVPTAALLLSAGLIGVVGFRRRSGN